MRGPMKDQDTRGYQICQKKSVVPLLGFAQSFNQLFSYWLRGVPRPYSQSVSMGAVLNHPPCIIIRNWILSKLYLV